MEAPPWRACCWSHDFEVGRHNPPFVFCFATSLLTKALPSSSFLFNFFFVVPDAAFGVAPRKPAPTVPGGLPPSLPLQFPSWLLFACNQVGSYTQPLGSSVHARHRNVTPSLMSRNPKEPYVLSCKFTSLLSHFPLICHGFRYRNNPPNKSRPQAPRCHHCHLLQC